MYEYGFELRDLPAASSSHAEIKGVAPCLALVVIPLIFRFCIMCLNVWQVKENKGRKPFPPSGVFSTCKGELLEVKDGNVKTQPAVLENLVFFVEVCLRLPEGISRALDLPLTLSHLIVWDTKSSFTLFSKLVHSLCLGTASECQSSSLRLPQSQFCPISSGCLL